MSEALRAGQQYGIIHRDLKPENILLTRAGIPKLADLGLAKRVMTDPKLTDAYPMMGTPSYMAPEQALDDTTADHRADIYSLGISLFHMTTGKRPFSGDSPISIAMAHANKELPSPAGFGARTSTSASERQRADRAISSWGARTDGWTR